LGQPCNGYEVGCSGRSQFYCLQPKNNDGICVKYAVLGEVCGYTEKGHVLCDDRFACNGVDKRPGVCVDPNSAKAGEVCHGAVGCADALCCDQTKDAKSGICRLRVGDGQACGGANNVVCSDGFSCLYQRHGNDLQGTCVSAARKLGESCGGYFENVECADKKNNYCKLSKHGEVGVCAKRPVENEGCGPFKDVPNPICADGFGCFIEQKDAAGKCVKETGLVGAKCSPLGGLECKEDQFCLRAVGAITGVCTAKSAIGQRCGTNNEGKISCSNDLTCFLKDDEILGVCAQTKNNKAGSPCNRSVLCEEHGYCHREADKAYGVCKNKPKLGEHCGREGSNYIPCDKGASCGSDRTCHGVNKLK